MAWFRDKYRVESARLKNWDYAAPGLYFVTICTRRREYFFGEIKTGVMHLSPIGEIIADEWLKTPSIRPYVDLDAWVVMPDHIHGIVLLKSEPVVETPRRGVSTTHPRRGVSTHPQRGVSTHPRRGDPPPPSQLLPNSLGAIIGQFKAACTRRIYAVGHREFGWQARFHDHIIRNQRELTNIRRYIANNPAQWETDHHHPSDVWM